MKPNKQKAIELLQQQLNEVSAIGWEGRRSLKFGKWWELTCMIVANVFGRDSNQFTDFEEIEFSLSVWSNTTPEHVFEEAFLSGLQSAEAMLGAFIVEVTTFWPDAVDKTHIADPQKDLFRILDRFHLVTRQLRSRHDGRATITVSDEYDVQDLLHALLKIHFEDVRPEEWTPSYAGSSSRMDFILSEHDTVIEVKKTRSSMKAKDLGDQLLIDIMRYKTHANAKTLWCFVYDPEGLLPNPVGVERDLSRNYDGVEVRCVVRPK